MTESARRLPFKQAGACFEDHNEALYSCAFNPYTVSDQEQLLAVAGINQVTIYSFLNNNDDFVPVICIRDPTLHLHEDYDEKRDEDNDDSSMRTDRVYAVNWLWDAKTRKLMVVFGGENGTLRVADASNGAHVRTHNGHGNIVNDIRVHPSNSLVYVSASKDMTVRVWNVRCPHPLAILAGFNGHRDQVLSCDWSPCGRYIATGCMDHFVRLWPVTDELQQRIDNTSNPMYKYVIDRSELLPCEGDLIDDTVEIGQHVAESGDLHTNYVDCVRFFHDFLFTKSSENMIVLSKFGDVEDGIAGMAVRKANFVETNVSQLAYLTVPKGDTWFLKFDIDPKRQWLAAGVPGGLIHMWILTPTRFPSKAPDFTLHLKEKTTIRQISFEPYGRYFACVCDDGGIRRFNRVEEDKKKRKKSPPPGSVITINS